MIRVEDQEENRALRAFRRCKEERLPLVVIAGKMLSTSWRSVLRY